MNIDPEIQRRTEHAYAEATERLYAVVDALYGAIEAREDLLGVQDDSIHYLFVRDFIRDNIVRHGSMPTAAICAAALFKLARAPRTTYNPLAQYEKEMKDD